MASLSEAVKSEGDVDMNETPARYAAYGNRFRTLLLASQRYIAYTSDIGESFRPVAHPYLVKGGYAVSWAYILGDVGYEGYKSYQHDGDAKETALVCLKRGVFQSIASMALPAFTIHSVVRYSGRAARNLSNTTLRTWGPVGLGLGVVPALPYFFDEPVEHIIDKTFEAVGINPKGGHSTADPAAGKITQQLKVAEKQAEKAVDRGKEIVDQYRKDK